MNYWYALAISVYWLNGVVTIILAFEDFQNCITFFLYLGHTNLDLTHLARRNWHSELPNVVSLMQKMPDLCQVRCILYQKPTPQTHLSTMATPRSLSPSPLGSRKASSFLLYSVTVNIILEQVPGCRQTSSAQGASIKKERNTMSMETCHQNDTMSPGKTCCGEAYRRFRCRWQDKLHLK